MMPVYLRGGLVYWNILHGMRCSNNLVQPCAPAGAHLATATDRLKARLQKVA